MAIGAKAKTRTMHKIVVFLIFKPRSLGYYEPSYKSFIVGYLEKTHQAQD